MISTCTPLSELIRKWFARKKRAVDGRRVNAISYPAVASGSAPPTYVLYSLYMLILPLDAKENSASFKPLAIKHDNLKSPCPIKSVKENHLQMGLSDNKVPYGNSKFS